MCLLLSPLLCAEAAYSGTVKYGGFEESKAVGVEPMGWKTYSTSPWYGNFTTGTDFVAEGSLSLKTVASKSTGTPQALISGAMYWGYFDTNAQYELSVRILVPEGSTVNDALLRAVLRDANGKTSDIFTPSAERISGDTDGKWKTVRLSFTPKRNFGALETVYIRCNGGQTGTAYWDDLQLHKLNADGTYADAIEEEIFSPESDVLINGDFSELNTTAENPKNWTPSGAWGTVAVLKQKADGENNAVTLCGSGAPYIKQSFSVQGGETYTIKGRFNTNGGTPIIKFSYTGHSEFTTENLGNTYGGWKDFRYDFKVPDGAKNLDILFRKYGETAVSYADLHVYKTQAAPLLTLKTDNETTFYYTTWESGQAIYTCNSTPTNGEKVRFYIWDGEKEIGVQEKPAEKEGTFTFSLAGLTKGKQYELCCALLSGSTVMDTAKKTIYCFDPPGAVNEKGQMKEADGTYTDVIFGYHVYERDFADAKKAGINVVQGMGDFETGSMGEYLDAAWAEGIRVLVPLYGGNMLPAGHPVNWERTEAIINAYKNHPGVFGWMIQDEPFLQMRNEPERVRQLLLDSYLLIRTLDSHHPTFMTADPYSPEHYVDIGNACDIIAPDDYALGAGRDISTVYTNMQKVNAAVRGRKPMYALLQTFAYAAGRQPTIDELMHMIYQSFFAGADAIGYYSFYETNWQFTDTVLYTDLRNACPELREAYRMFRRTDLTYDGISDGILVRKFADGAVIFVNLEGTEKTLQVDNISLTYGDGSLKKDGEKKVLSLGVYGRAQGEKGMIPFTNLTFLDGEGKPIQKLEAGEITVRIVLDGKVFLSEGTTLWVVRQQETAGIREVLDFKMCKAETNGSFEAKINASGREGESIEVLLFAPSGQPIYKKAVMQ